MRKLLEPPDQVRGVSALNIWVTYSYIQNW
jgi:hypothetical protein